MPFAGRAWPQLICMLLMPLFLESRQNKRYCTLGRLNLERLRNLFPLLFNIIYNTVLYYIILCVSL